MSIGDLFRLSDSARNSEEWEGGVAEDTALCDFDRDTNAELDTTDQVNAAHSAQSVAFVSEMEVNTRDTRDTRDNTVVFQLENGSYHVCRGKKCLHTFTRYNAIEKELVCGLSGRVVATSMEANGDVSWTGRSTGSADPDLGNAGCISNVWKNKRDAFSVSASAWQKSTEIAIEDVEEDDDEYTTRIPKASDSLKPSIKRGAPCVIHTSDNEIQLQRREKAVKRNLALKDFVIVERLRKDASNVIAKLFSVPLDFSDEGAEGAAASATTATAATAATTATTAAAVDAASLDDPRLQNYDFVFLVGLRRYVARCKAENMYPTLDTIHNIASSASVFVKSRQKAAKKKSQRVPSKHSMRQYVTNGQTIEFCASLICALWVAVCSTPPFKESQFGDSFRPFAAGILYAMKKGVVMNDIDASEFELVPQIHFISDQLPTLKTSTTNYAARQLQSSSHKGICALHRAIASVSEVDEDEQKEILSRFKAAARVGFQLLEHVSSLVVMVGKMNK